MGEPEEEHEGEEQEHEDGAVAAKTHTVAAKTHTEENEGLALGAECVEHAKCVFPFKYYGVTYNVCTDIGTGGHGEYQYCWCSTENNAAGEFVVGSGKYVKCGAVTSHARL